MISTVPYGSCSTQPRPGSWDISSSRCRRFIHLPTFLAAKAASPAVLATSANHASNGERPRSLSSASAIAVSFSVISRSSARSWPLRHSTLRVRPVANVCRRRRTVAGMSVVVLLTSTGATDSVVMVGSSWPVEYPNPNQPPGW